MQSRATVEFRPSAPTKTRARNVSRTISIFQSRSRDLVERDDGRFFLDLGAELAGPMKEAIIKDAALNRYYFGAGTGKIRPNGAAPEWL